MNELRNIDESLPVLNDINLVKLFLHGNDFFDDKGNQCMFV